MMDMVVPRNARPPRAFGIPCIRMRKASESLRAVVSLDESRRRVDAEDPKFRKEIKKIEQQITKFQDRFCGNTPRQRGA